MVATTWTMENAHAPLAPGEVAEGTAQSERPQALRRSWAAHILTAEGVEGELRRLGLGLGLGAVWGLSAGMYGGLGELWRHAAAVTQGLLLEIGLAVPACYILLSLLDSPLTASAVVQASSRAVFRVGLIYAGLAPVTALYASTVGVTGAVLVVPLVFFAGGGVGLCLLLFELARGLTPAPFLKKAQCYGVLVGFAVLSVSLGVRSCLALPILGGM